MEGYGLFSKRSKLK